MIAAVLAIVTAAGIIASCGGGDETPASAPPVATTYVGKVAGSRALVGIVTRGDRVRAYVCDGRRVGVWFDARLADGSIGASAKGATLSASIDGRSATGSVTIDGRVQRFAATVATGGAGLYRGTATGYVAGWVVLADGTQRGVFGSTDGTSAAPKLSSKAIADGRVAITPIPIPGATAVRLPFRIAPSGGIGPRS